jgi:hypothetical protein
MMATTTSSKCFPCSEQPMRIRLRSDQYGFHLATGNRRKGNGKVFSTCKGRDEFILHRNPSDPNTVSIQKSTDAGRLLAVKYGALCTTVVVTEEEETNQNSENSPKDEQEHDLQTNESKDEFKDEREAATVEVMESKEGNDDDSTKWCLVKSSSDGIMLQSLSSSGNGMMLSCTNEKGIIGLAMPDESCLWHADIVTGELCFISNTSGRLRCDLLGLLTLTDNWKGWEVWRFMEAGHGHIKISSWMHNQYVLCCDEEGNITTCSYTDETKSSHWAVEKAATGDGVVFRSASYDKLLSTKVVVTNDERNTTKVVLELAEQPKEDEPTPAAALWQMEAAHRQTYSLIHTRKEEKPLSLGPFPYVTPNHKQMDHWTLEQRDDGTVTLLLQTKAKSKEEQPPVQYLGCDVDTDNDVKLSEELGETELWVLEAGVGGYKLRSNKKSGAYLSFMDSDDVNSELCTTTISLIEPSSDVATEEDQLAPAPTLWQLDPCMPRAVSSSKIKTFAIGTTAAIATTVAMPFAMAGVMGVLGAVGAEVGILANIVTVGLTGAEAIASVGVVGATAAIVFRESSDTLTIDDGNEDDDDHKNAYSKRPFCAWRSW